MAKESIKNQVEPVSPETVGETIESAIPKHSAGSIVEQNQTAIIVEEKVIPVTNITQKIYVGPNILGLPKYTVVETTFTPHINSFIEKCPEIEKLFVPILEMAEVESRTKVKGTLENRYFNTIREFYSVPRKEAN